MKIEIDKPVIPQFVADWIEQLYGQGFYSDDLLEALFSRNYEVAELRIFEWFTDDKERAVTAILYGYEVEKEPLYYAKSKLTGQYLGNKDIGIGSCVQQPFWFFDKGHLQIEKLTKEVFKKVYGLDDTNADFEEVE